jgi:uncharacterized membrane protein YiaA
MTHKERKELLERRMTLCRRVFICSGLALGIINSPNVALANYFFGLLFGLSILYGLYNFHLEMNTDAYKDESEDDDNINDYT